MSRLHFFVVVVFIQVSDHPQTGDVPGRIKLELHPRTLIVRLEENRRDRPVSGPAVDTQPLTVHLHLNRLMIADAAIQAGF